MRVTILILACLSLSLNSAYAIEVTQDGKKVDVPVCGGFAGLRCNSNQWCDYPKDSVCGIADRFGTCRPKPEICAEIYKPVCGCNGQTFGNACEAAGQGQDVAYAGPCRSDPAKK